MAEKKKPVAFISSALTSEDYGPRVFEYFTIIAAHLSIQMRKNNYEVVFFVPHLQEKAGEEQTDFINYVRINIQDYSGVIISPFQKSAITQALGDLIRTTNDHNIKTKNRAERIPVLTIDKGYEDEDFNVVLKVKENKLSAGYVMCDETEGGRKAAQCLFYHFFHTQRKIAQPPVVVIFKGLEGSQLRIKGFKDEMKKLVSENKYKLEIAGIEIEAKYKRSLADIKATECLNDPKTTLSVTKIDAFFCCNDEMALGIRDVLVRRHQGLNNQIADEHLRYNNGLTPEDKFRQKIGDLNSERYEIEQIRIIGFDGIREVEILIREGDKWLLNSVDVKIGQQVEFLADLFFLEKGEKTVGAVKCPSLNTAAPARTKYKDPPDLVNKNYYLYH